MQSVYKDAKAFFYYFGFWLIMCFLDRLVFILSFLPKMKSASLMDFLEIYYHGFLLDLSVSAYICAIPFLLYCLFGLLPKVNFKRKALNIYTLIVLILFVITSFANVNIYREWGDKISKRAIDAIFEDAMGAVASAESTPVLIPVLGIILGVSVGYWIYKRIFRNITFQEKSSAWTIAVQFCLVGLLLFTCIRGGYGRSPLNPSRAYFTQKTFYNHAAVNTQYALIREYFSRNQRSRSPYVYFTDEKQREAVLKPIFTSNPDSSKQILKTERPNIVLIVLESFVADLIESTGGEKGITPHMEEFIKEGVLFNNLYAASDRSDKGLVAVFSGFPAQGPESIIKYIDKHENMPAIGQEIQAAGYHTAFYHGGQSEFYNMKSYMLTHGIEEVVDNVKFNPLEPRSSWGVFDDVVFNRMLEDINEEELPFFYSIFTLVNHEPFELRGDYKFGKNTNANKFRSTANYTDQTVFEFIESAKKAAWYKNTLFIIVADHGHRLPSEKWDITHPKRFHIPLIFFGDVIKDEYKGTKISRLGNQTDLAKTLLTQLRLPTDKYKWSRDLFNSTYPEAAFYNSKDAFGIITKDQTISYDRVGNLINYKWKRQYPQVKNDSLLNIAKAYNQGVYNDFMKY